MNSLASLHFWWCQLILVVSVAAQARDIEGVGAHTPLPRDPLVS